MTALEILRQGGDFSRYRRLFTPTVDQAELAEARAVAVKAAALLKNEFFAKRVVLFGSAARADTFDRTSDVDLAVWGVAPGRFFAAVARVNELSPKWKIDLYGPHPFGSPMEEVIGRQGIDL
jgi:predicted nucleotidyltransferase